MLSFHHFYSDHLSFFSMPGWHGCTTYFSTSTCFHEGIDLLITDIPEGLQVPNISSPSKEVPEWN
jgi:hypothetical protein